MAQANERTYNERVKQVTTYNAFKFLIEVKTSLFQITYNLREQP